MTRKLLQEECGIGSYARFYDAADTGITAFDLTANAGTQTGTDLDVGGFTQFTIFIVPTGAGTASAGGVTPAVILYNYDKSVTLTTQNLTTAGITIATTVPWIYSFGFGLATPGATGTAATGAAALRGAPRIAIKLTNAAAAGTPTLTAAVYLLASA